MPTNPNEHPSVAIKELQKTEGTDEEFETVVETEVETLEMLRKLDHTHLIKAIAYYKKGGKHYVMFPWANRGNLRDFWNKDPPTLDTEYLKWAFTQFCGLAEAIKELHHAHRDQHWRHGDLKPENILCFEEAGPPNSVGTGSCTLVIADVGLSKSHKNLTEARIEATRTRSGTIMYEPPETEMLPDRPRSRRYDIWSMGCIYLEFVIWLLYGAAGLKQFREDLRTTAMGGSIKFYVMDASQQTAQLSNAVQKWIEHIQNDPRCPIDTTLHKIVELVVTKLLVAEEDGRLGLTRADSAHDDDKPDVEVPSTPTIFIRSATIHFDAVDDSYSSSRAKAWEMHAAIKQILDYATDEKIHWMNFDASVQKGPGLYAKNLAVSDAISTGRRSAGKEVRY